MSLSNKKKLLLLGAFTLLLTVVIFFINNQKSQQSIVLRMSNEGRRDYMSSEDNRLVSQMYETLDSIVSKKNPVILNEIARKFGSDLPFNFFADSLNGVIVAHQESYLIGKDNSSVGGPLWEAIFFDLVNRLPADRIVTKSYPGRPEIDERGERYGVFYKDTTRQLLFGLVVTDDYLNIKDQQSLSSSARLGKLMVGLLALFAIVLLLALWYILRLSESRKKQIQKNLNLQKREAEYNRIIDASHSAIAILDVQSRILRINKAFDDWYGGGYLGKKMSKESTHQGFDDRFKECLEDGRTTYYNSGNRNGRLKASIITMSLVDIETERRVVFIGADVTEHAFIRRAIGHELKTPISKIIGALDILSAEIGGSRFFDLAHGMTQELLTQVESLEQWAGIHYDQVKLHRQPLDASSVIKSIVDERYKALFRFSQITVESNIEENLCVKMTPGHLDLIVLNIISNAVKELSNYRLDSRFLSITAKKIGNLVSISIKDSGRGVDMETQRSLYQLNRGFNSLGSDLVAHFVKENDGKVTVESDGQQGTVVQLKFNSYAI